MDIQESAKWYRMAAEGGDEKAQANLGLLYLDGRGVKKDLVQAFAWLKASASQGWIVGRNYMDDFYANKLLSAQQLEEGNRLFQEIRQRTTKHRPPLGKPFAVRSNP